MFRNLERFVFPTTISVVIVVLAVVSVTFGTDMALEGTYALVGLLAGATIYYRFTECRNVASGTDLVTPTRVRLAAKGVPVVVLISLSYVLAAGNRAPVLVVAVPVGYALLGVQYVGDQSPRVLVPQIAAVFALSPVTKALSTGFYWGAGDLFRRTGEIQELLRAGSIEGIAGRYIFWPGLHLLSGSVSLVTGVEVHDSLLATGAVTYTALIVGTYALGNLATARTEFALSVALVASFLRPVHRFASFFFPQALAVAMAMFALLPLLRESRSSSIGNKAAGFLLVAAIVFTHQLTLILLIPLAALLIVVSWINADDVLRPTQFLMFFVALLLAGLTHWSFTGRAWFFFVQLTRVLTYIKTFGTFIGFSGGGSAQSLFAFGQLTPSVSPTEAIMNPAYVYGIAVMALFSLGVTCVLSNEGSYRRIASVLVAGVMGSVLIFRTPLAVKGLSRLGHPWVIPFAFVVGAGLSGVKLMATSSLGRRVLVTLLVVCGTTGAMAAADDLGRFGPSPVKEHSFDHSELQEVRASSDFQENHGRSIEAFWIVSEAYHRFGTPVDASPELDDSGFQTGPGLFVYRSSWPEHEVAYDINRTQGSFYVSERYLDGVVTNGNQVYTTGEVGMLWTENRTTLSASARN